MKHTAGPWIGKATGSSDQGLIYSENDGRNVAVAYDVRDLDLIAAAPDLLEALKIVRQCLKSTSDLTKLGDLIYENKEMICLAIQKTEGNA